MPIRISTKIILIASHIKSTCKTSLEIKVLTTVGKLQPEVDYIRRIRGQPFPRGPQSQSKRPQIALNPGAKGWRKTSHLLTTRSHLWNKINNIIIIFTITTTIIIIFIIIIRVVFNLLLKNQYQSNYSNHNNRKQHGEPVRIPSNYLYLRAQVKLHVLYKVQLLVQKLVQDF